MEQVWNILNASFLFRWLAAAGRWIGGQWQRSRVVQGFLHPSEGGQARSEASVFAWLWARIHGLLCWLYEKLRLEKLLGGSMFTQLWFWCMLPMVFGALLPTMVVAALEAVAVCSLLLNFARSRQRTLVYSPINKYVMLYCVVYAAGTIASVTPREIGRAHV